MKYLKKYIFVFLLLLIANMSAVWSAGKAINTENIPQLFENIFTKTFHDADTAKNAQNINGQSSNNFLRKIHNSVVANNKCSGKEVITGIDENGNPICQNKEHSGVKINIIEGSVEVKNKNIPKKTLGLGSFIYLEDELQFQTKNTTGAVLQFDKDKSIIRMDKNTGVKLTNRADKTDNTLLAQVTLENGILWGRVLNNAKVDFKYGQIMAGVRGTSVLVASTTPGKPGGIEVVDSMKEKYIGKLEHEGISFCNGFSCLLITGIFYKESTGESIPCSYGHEFDKCKNNYDDKKKDFTKKDLVYMNRLMEKYKEECIGECKNIKNEWENTKPHETFPGSGIYKPIHEKWLCGEMMAVWKNTIENETEICQDKNISFKIWETHFRDINQAQKVEKNENTKTEGSKIETRSIHIGDLNQIKEIQPRENKKGLHIIFNNDMKSSLLFNQEITHTRQDNCIKITPKNPNEPLIIKMTKKQSRPIPTEIIGFSNETCTLATSK